ncbi:DUF2690 domain-containing protein [Streptomyces sp. NPDC001020]
MVDDLGTRTASLTLRVLPRARGTLTRGRRGCLGRQRGAGGGPRVELRNSARCSTAWARIQKANDSWRFKIEIRGGHSYLANASLSYEAYTQAGPA